MRRQAFSSSHVCRRRHRLLPGGSKGFSSATSPSHDARRRQACFSMDVLLQLASSAPPTTLPATRLRGAGVEVQGTPLVTWKPVEISIGGIAISFIAMVGCIALVASREEDQMLSLAITEMETDLMNEELAVSGEITRYMVQEIEQIYEKFVKNIEDSDQQLFECKNILLELKHDLTLLQEKKRRREDEVA